MIQYQQVHHHLDQKPLETVLLMIIFPTFKYYFTYENVNTLVA